MSASANVKRFVDGGAPGPGRPRSRLRNVEAWFLRDNASRCDFNTAAMLRQMRERFGCEFDHKVVATRLHNIRVALDRISRHVAIRRHSSAAPTQWQVAVPPPQLRTLLNAESEAAMTLYRQYFRTQR